MSWFEDWRIGTGLVVLVAVGVVALVVPFAAGRSRTQLYLDGRPLAVLSTVCSDTVDPVRWRT